MKLKYTLIVVTTLFYFQGKTQLDKKFWLLGGNISFSSANYRSDFYGSNQNAFNFQIAPNIGYFIKNKFAIGVKTAIKLEGIKAIGTNLYAKYNNYSAGPFCRYYFLPIDNRVNILAEVGYQYGSEGGKGVWVPKNTFSCSGGIVTFLNSCVGVEFLVGYTSYKFSDYKGTNDIIQLGLGFQFHLEKEK